jgi:hypothetical protein
MVHEIPATPIEFATVRRFCPICDGESDIPADMFGTMAEMPKYIARSFREPRRIEGEGWTPHQVVAHMADVEVVLGWRIRQVLAENEPDLQPFNEDLWGIRLFYGERDLATSLATFAANRQSNLELLRLAGEDGLERRYSHPEFGNRPIRVFVEHIADHDVLHLRQIRGE